MSITVQLSVNGVETEEMLVVPRDADIRWLADRVREIADIPIEMQRVSIIVSFFGPARYRKYF